LLRAFQHGEVTWPEFGKRYRAELLQSEPFDQNNPLIKNHGQKFTLRLLQELASHRTVTLLCHCAEDEPHCHRHLLKAILDRKV
jgi:uncharacterized protein YeaO (DUF488 family)